MMSPRSKPYEPESPVPPGNITGVYVIVVAGLPWNTSWQTLKDFSGHLPHGKNAHIDHAMVYPNSTDGYVIVRGKKTFRKVLRYLDGAILNNRSLLADGRNETSYLTLRPVDITKRQSCPAGQEHSRKPQKAPPHQPPPPPSQLANPYMQNCFGPPHISQQVLMPQPDPYAFNSPDASPVWNYSPQLSSGTFSPRSTAFSFSGSTYTSQPSPIFLAVNQLPHAMPNVALPAPYPMPMMPPAGHLQWHPNQPLPPQQVIRTEARKIIIKRLPCPTNEVALEALLREVLPQACQCEHKIYIARSRLKELKGYAFVTFKSIHTAQVAIDRLNGFQWRGKTLIVSIAKEGAVSPRSRSFRNNKPPQNYRKPPPSRGRPSATPLSITPTSKSSFMKRSESVGATNSVIESTIPSVPLLTESSDSSDPSILEVCVPPRTSGTPAVVDGSLAS